MKQQSQRRRLKASFKQLVIRPKAPKRIKRFALLLGLSVILPIYIYGPQPEPPGGSPEHKPRIEHPVFDTLPLLDPTMQQKLEREIYPYLRSPKPHYRDRLGIVYALVATRNDWYPCYSCNDRDSIYLKRGEVWKYGETSKGENGRYRQKTLKKLKVRFIPLYRGPLIECKIREKVLIYHYKNLPENLARPVSEQLPRPPGNKIYR